MSSNWNQQQQEEEDTEYSATATLIAFDPPLPLLRRPISAGLSDNPSLLGPFVLAFKDDLTWKSAFRACQSKLIYQCQEGARIGCSISASNKCNPPWWRTLFGGATIDFSERERCEEREMSACFAASVQSCLKFANDRCSVPFRDARISLIDQMEVAARSDISQSNDSRQLLSVCSLEVTNYRGTSLLDSETTAEVSSSISSSK
ncbi:hypothetical protein AQUCO_02000588v1 [Aquilegia coerulea]|uniref:Uncharacterized protein n=1 Tax=Aquilegia coerulea TaxID=218851 RepID=A0A2G5DIB3_AQUCA|nr:hypothetical protein AQUCO_02000588v1 [Aquilegia coerulea]